MAKKVSRVEVVEDDIFSALRQSSISTEAKTRLLKDSLIEIDAALKTIKKDAAGIKGGLFKTDPSDVKNQKDIAQAMKESSRLAADNTSKIRAKANATKLLTVEEAKLKEATRRANVETKQIARLQMAAKGSVEQLRAKLQVLTTQYDKLSTAERTNTDRGKRLKAGIDQTTASVTKLEQATGRHQRNVGNYGSSLDGLKGKFRSLIGFVGQLGLAMGGVVILRNSIQTIVEFDSAIADLSAITGATGKDLDFFKNKAIELGVNVKGGASAVVEAYKLIGSAKPELLENAAALNEVTEAAILLAKASGMELPEAATALTDAMNQFGVGADQAGKFVDVLAAGAKFGAAEIPQITEALLKFGAVAKTTNVSIQESTGLIEALAERGLKGAEAGTALRNVMLKLSAPDALPKEAQERLKALGINFDDLKDKSKPFSERLEALKPLLNDNAALVKTFGTENAVAATTLLSSTERIKELTASVDENGVALDQANARSKTIAEAFNRLKETINSMILSFANGSDASGKLVTSLDFISKHIGTIIKVLGKLIVLWISYKTVMLALKMKDRISEFTMFNKAVASGDKSIIDATASTKKMGMALKSIGWIALIAFVVELSMAFYDAASGAKLFREGLESFSKFDKVFMKQTKATVKAILDRNLAEGKTAESIKATNKELNEQIGYLKDDYDNLKLGLEIMRENEKAQGGLTLKQEEARREQLRLMRSLKERIGLLRDTRDGLTDEFKAEQDAIDSKGDLTEETKKLNTELKKQNEYLSEQTELLEQLDEVSRRAEIRDIQTDIDAQIANLAKIARETGELDVDELESTIQRKFELEKEHIQERELFEINAIREKYRIDAALARQSLEDDKTKLLEQEGLSPEQKLEIEANYQKELAKLEQDELQRAADLELQIRLIKSSSNEELIELQKAHNDEINEVNDELIDAQIQGAVETNDKIIESDKEAADRRKEIADFVTDYLIAQSNKRIDQLDKEIAAAETQADFLRQLAVEGNINAKESIAEQQRIINEANKQKAKEEQLQQRIKLAGSVYSTFTAKTEAGSKNALAETITDITLLDMFINSLAGHSKGIEDTGDKGSIRDKDGKIVTGFVHKKERVLSEEQNAPLLAMGLSNDELVRRIQMSDIKEKTEQLSYTTGWENTALIASLSGVESGIKRVEKAIKEKPVTEYSLEYVTSELFDVVKKVTNGNDIIYNRYRQDK